MIFIDFHESFGKFSTFCRFSGRGSPGLNFSQPALRSMKECLIDPEVFETLLARRSRCRCRQNGALWGVSIIWGRFLQAARSRDLRREFTLPGQLSLGVEAEQLLDPFQLQMGHDTITLSGARSRLDRRRFSRPNTHFAAFFKLYKKIIFSRANLQNFAKKKITDFCKNSENFFWKFSEKMQNFETFYKNFADFLQNFAKSCRFWKMLKNATLDAKKCEDFAEIWQKFDENLTKSLKT